MTDSPDMLEPIRIVERYLQELGRPVRAETVGADPAVDQLRSHLPNVELWNAVAAQRDGVDTYARGMHGVIETFEADAIRLTGMARGYGFGHLGMDPSGPSSFLDGFLYGPFMHAFALLGGQAPGPFRTTIDPVSAQYPSTFKLRGGWDQMTDAAVGDEPSIAQAQVVLHELDEQLLRSSELRRVWGDYVNLQSGHRALVGRFAEIDQDRLNRGTCWGCSAQPPISSATASSAA